MGWWVPPASRLPPPVRKDFQRQRASLIAMASVIVVDSELGDSVREYAGIIDAANQNNALAEAVAPFFPTKGTNEPTNRAELTKTIYAHLTPETYAKLLDKEYESLMNLLIHILINASRDFKLVIDSKDAPIYKLLQATVPAKQPSLRDRRVLKPTTIISVLNTLFNLLPESLATRVAILEYIFTVIDKLRLDFSLFEENIGHNLVQWLKAAQVPQGEIARVFWKFIALDTKHTVTLLHLINDFCKQFPLDLPQLHSLIDFVLALDVVDVSFLVNANVANAIAANKGDDKVALFDHYVRGEPVLLTPAVVAKSQILQVAKFFSDHPNQVEYSYSDIPVAQGAALEALLVQAIKAGVIEGKLDQVLEMFFLTRANKFIIAGTDHAADWATVKQALTQWKQALTGVNEVVKLTRESIVNANA